MSVYTNISNQLTIYLGYSFFIAGILGNSINVGVFYNNNLRNPSTLLLFPGSCFNLQYIIFGLLTRILSAGLNIDASFNDLGWCKMRFYLLQLCALISVSCICYATIDQFFVSSQRERLRRLSNFSATVRAICILILFWILYSIPLLIVSNLVQLNGGRVVCTFTSNLYFTRFASYFNLPIVWSMGPITVLIIFGILTYRNVSLLKNARNRERTQHHLTSMILLHIIFIVIGTLPYAFYYTYSAITVYVAKSTDRRAIETFLSNVVAVVLYFPNSCSFFVYYAASVTYRQQVKQFLHIPTRPYRIEPGGSLILRRGTLDIY